MRQVDRVGRPINNLARIVGRNQTSLLVALFTLIAFALRVYHLDARGLFGDEYNSLMEAIQFGRNPQSLVYFGILKVWMLFETSDFGVRFPSVVFGVMSVPAAYQFGRRLISKRIGLVLALLIALSPFAIQYSQTVRFYSLFLLATLLSLASFVSLYKHPHSRSARAIWLGTSLLVIFSHLFGIFVPFFELVAWWLASARGKSKIVYIGLVAAVLLGSIAVSPLLINPTTLGIIGKLYASYALPLTGHSRGLGLANLAKVPLTLYFFSLGEGVYPFALPFSVLGLLLFGAAAIFGVIKLRKNQFALFLLIAELIPLILVYLALDPAAPAFSDTAAPRHVMMALPVFLTLVAVGFEGLPFKWLGALGIGGILLYSLSSYYLSDWNYTLPGKADLRQVAEQIQAESDKQTVVLYDGRSAASLNRYLDPSLKKESYWNYLDSESLAGLGTQRVVLVVDNSHFQHSASFDEFIQLLEQEYQFRSGQVNYPFFNYVFDRKNTSASSAYRVEPSGEVSLPKEIYGLEFQDLNLPAQAAFQGSNYNITGSYSLAGPDNNEREIPLDGSPTARQIVLLSDVTGASHLRQGQVIGELTVKAVDGTAQALPLRLGSETQDWSKECDPSMPCRTALTWHKFFALVGQYGYEGAWSDFQAKIFGVSIPLSESRIQSITVHYTAGSGEFHVWGMSLH